MPEWMLPSNSYYTADEPSNILICSWCLNVVEWLALVIYLDEEEDMCEECAERRGLKVIDE